MQNPHVKYLKTKKGYFYLFYYEQGSILCRHYAGEGWSSPQKIAEKTAPIFSLCQYGEKAHLLYSNIDGQLFMASSADLNQWEHHAMAEELRSTGNTKFFLLPTENAFHLIYHQSTESTGVDSLLYTVFRHGKWEKPYQIDRFMPMQKTPFLARRLSREHIILYYRTGRNILSAREMLLEPYTIGSVTPLVQTPSPFSDLSIVNDNEKIHLLYIVRGMFRTQVVYQYKHTSAISTPRILWEDNNCDNCMVYLQKGKVILMWTMNGQPMRCISETGGATFGTVEKYTDPFPARCMKAELLGTETVDFNSTECYGDRNNMLPAIYPLSAPSAPQKPTKPGIPKDNHSKSYTALQERHKQQVEELSALLAQRSDEITAVNARWRNQTEKLERELTALRQENALLKLQSIKKEKDV
ncbi:bZIP transcription factor [Anaerotignum sp.]